MGGLGAVSCHFRTVLSREAEKRVWRFGNATARTLVLLVSYHQRTNGAMELRSQQVRQKVSVRGNGVGR